MVPERKHLPSYVGCTGLAGVGLPQGRGGRAAGNRRDARRAKVKGEAGAEL